MQVRLLVVISCINLKLAFKANCSSAHLELLLHVQVHSSIHYACVNDYEFDILSSTEKWVSLSAWRSYSKSRSLLSERLDLFSPSPSSPVPQPLPTFSISWACVQCNACTCVWESWILNGDLTCMYTQCGLQWWVTCCVWCHRVFTNYEIINDSIVNVSSVSFFGIHLNIQDYSTDGMTDSQREFMQHLREFGLIYQRKVWKKHTLLHVHK